jgi:hypothetical protein
VEPFETVRRADAGPVLTREHVELGGCGEALLEAAQGLGDLAAEALGEVVELLAWS